MVPMGPDIMIVLVIVLIVVLMWRGPKMLPQIGNALGRTVKDTKAELDEAFKKDDGSSGTPAA
jgi:Sec-independent protein translocase protein TatA